MKLLAIETSSDVCGIALLEEDQVVAYREEILNREHAEKLPKFYKKLMDEVEFNLIELNGIAISIGPGSFTGLRIGLSFAKGLAFSVNVPLLPISTLLAITESCKLEVDEVSSILHSHKDIVYYQKFSKKKDGWEGIDNPVSIAWEKLSPKLYNHKNIVHYRCGYLLDVLELESNIVEIIPSSVSIGKAALTHFENIVNPDFYNLEPEYITSFKIG